MKWSPYNWLEQKNIKITQGKMTNAFFLKKKMDNLCWVALGGKKNGNSSSIYIFLKDIDHFQEQI